MKLHFWPKFCRSSISGLMQGHLCWWRGGSLLVGRVTWGDSILSVSPVMPCRYGTPTRLDQIGQKKFSSPDCSRNSLLEPLPNPKCCQKNIFVLIFNVVWAEGGGNAIERVAVYECWLPTVGSPLLAAASARAGRCPAQTGHIELQHDPKHRTKQY